MKKKTKECHETIFVTVPVKIYYDARPGAREHVVRAARNGLYVEVCGASVDHGVYSYQSLMVGRSVATRGNR